MSVNGDEAEVDVLDDGYDDSAYQGCYIFRTAEADLGDIDDRPKKKRKVSKSNSVERQPRLLPKLLDGREPDSLQRMRLEAFEEVWAAHQTKIDEIIAVSNNTLLEDIARFVRYAPKSETESKLPTGLVVVGRDSSAQQRLLRQWQSDERTKSSECLIQLDHSQAVNITSALKTIIKSAISSSLGPEGYADFLSRHKRLIPMNYDLELLQRYATEQKVEKVVISLLAVEAFDSAVLSDVLAMIASWTDRIPFVMLIGISTTVELFEVRLSKSVIRRLLPRVFNQAGHEGNPIYEIFMATQHNAANHVWLGPVAAKSLFDRFREQELTPEDFSLALKYVHMSHFFANALCVLMTPAQNLEAEALATIAEAVRNTSSFMSHVEELLNGSAPKATKAREVTKLLNDDRALFSAIQEALTEGRKLLSRHYTILDDLKHLVLSIRDHAISFKENLPQYSVRTRVTDDFFQITVDAMQGPAGVEHMLEDLGLFDTLEQLSSESFDNIMCFETPWFEKQALMRRRLEKLHEKSKGESVHLSKASSQPTGLQKEYQAIQEAFVDLIETELRANIVNPTGLFLHEAFVYNSKTPLAQAFTPGPRYAIERALDRPSDYLGCECCTSENGSSQPPTAILWRLWCEAGGVVNVRDLWEAFKSTLVPQTQDEEEEEQENERDGNKERQALALFYRSLAELQMLGMLKQSKRKPGVECLAKIGWRGM